MYFKKFILLFPCWSTHCLVECYLTNMYLWSFRLLPMADFKFNSIVIRKGAWYDFSLLVFIKTGFVDYGGHVLHGALGVVHKQ